MRTRSRKAATKDEAAPAQGMKSVTVTEKYTAPIEQPDKETKTNQTIIHGFVPPDTPDAMDDSDVDPLDEWMDRIEEQQGLLLRFDRVKDYDLTGIWGKGALTIYCGVLPISKEALRNDYYLEAIQKRHGAGAYRCQLRYTNAGIIKTFLAIIEKSSDDAPPVTYGQKSQASNGDPLKAITEQVTQINQLREALSLGQTQTPVMVPGEKKPPTLEERLLDVVLARATTTGDKDQLDRLVDRVIGKDDASDGWTGAVMGFAKELVTPMLPSIGQAIGNVIERAASNYFAGAPQTSQPAQPISNGASSAPGNVPAVIVPPAPPGLVALPPVNALAPAVIEWFNQETDDPLLNLCKKFRIDVMQAYPVDQLVEAYYSFTDMHQDLIEQVQFLIAEEPTKILTDLSIPSSVQTLQYVVSFQQMVKDQFDDEDEGEENHDQSTATQIN